MAEKKEEKEKPEDEEIVMVGDGAEQPDADEENEENDENEEGSDSEEASGEGSDDDERTGHSEEDEERGNDNTEERRRARREERHRRRNRAREFRERDQTELRFLRGRNEELERRFSELDVRTGRSELMQIDSRISQIDGHIAQASDVIAKAISASKGEDAAEAQKIKDDLEDKKRQLIGYRSRVEGAVRQKVQGGGGPAVNPRVKERAERWISENSDWFNRDLSDEDSVIAKAIEDHLYREGRLDPTTDAYWAEVDRRVAKRLPHLDGDRNIDRREERDTDTRRRNGNGNGNGSNGKNGDSRPRGGPKFSTGGRERRLGKNEVYVSPERRAAMQAAGVWDDPALRAKYLRSYQRYDREAGRSRH